jgi:predicted N-acyltransferase
MAEHWVMFVATRGSERIAASLIAVDAVSRSAWGRYWGCTEHVPCLHFEACYYQPLAWCIEHDYVRFEGGAQGEHKMARGLLPVKTASAHWLRDARFASAVADHLAREGAGVDAYVDELRERSPFRPAAGEPPPSSRSRS